MMPIKSLILEIVGKREERPQTHSIAHFVIESRPKRRIIMYPTKSSKKPTSKEVGFTWRSCHNNNNNNYNYNNHRDSASFKSSLLLKSSHFFFLSILLSCSSQIFLVSSFVSSSSLSSSSSSTSSSYKSYNELASLKSTRNGEKIFRLGEIASRENEIEKAIKDSLPKTKHSLQLDHLAAFDETLASELTRVKVDKDGKSLIDLGTESLGLNVVGKAAGSNSNHAAQNKLETSSPRKQVLMKQLTSLIINNSRPNESLVSPPSSILSLSSSQEDKLERERKLSETIGQLQDELDMERMKQEEVRGRISRDTTQTKTTPTTTTTTITTTITSSGRDSETKQDSRADKLSEMKSNLQVPAAMLLLDKGQPYLESSFDSTEIVRGSSGIGGEGEGEAKGKANEETTSSQNGQSLGSSLLLSGDDDLNQQTASSFLPTSSEINGLSGGTSSEEYVTCPPDYEDSVIMISDKIGSQQQNNLSSEQQQQLYADSSGLLNGMTTNTGSVNDTFKMLASNSNSNESPPCYQPGWKMIEMITKVITPILFSIIIVVGLVGNIIVMLVILEDRKLERELTPTGLLILDLSLADLSFIIFCIPFTGWDYAVGHWVFGPLWCKFNQYLIVVCALSSIYTLVLMSVDRFIAIVYPIECIALRTSKNTLHAIYIKWIVILIMASPTIPRHGLINSPLEPELHNCRFLADQYDPLYFQIAFFVLSYLFPLILIFFLYLSLLNKLWFGSKPHGHKESIKTLESKKKVTWLVAGIVIVFALCWCPIQVMLILMRLKNHKITATYVAIQVFSHTLGYMNSCVNPIVYAFASESFLNSFKRSSLGRFCYRCLCLHNNQANHNNDIHHNNERTIISTNNSNRTTLNHANNNDHTTNNSLNNSSPQNKSNQYSSNYQLPSLNNKNSSNKRQSGNSMINDTNLSTSTLCTTSLKNNINNNNNKPNQFNKIILLPLEPRDRPSQLLPPSPSAVGLQPTKNQQTITHNKSINNSNKQTSNSCASFFVNSNPNSNNDNNNNINHNDNTGQDSSINIPLPTKQQLVARVIQSSNQVSHRCEPTYHRSLVAP